MPAKSIALQPRDGSEPLLPASERCDRSRDVLLVFKVVLKHF